MCITWMHDASITVCFEWPCCEGPDRCPMSWKLHNEGMNNTSHQLPEATTGLLFYLWRSLVLEGNVACTAGMLHFLEELPLCQEM